MNETLISCFHRHSVYPAAHQRAFRRAVAGTLAMGAVVSVAGCDRVQSELNEQPVIAAAVDPVWKADSTMLAKSPGILFRIVEGKHGRLAAPFATIGAQGFRRIRMGPRGWRALDLQYLHPGSTLRAVKNGRGAGTIEMARGFWEGGAQLDSLTDCRIIPAGLTAGVDAGTTLAIAGPVPTLNTVAPLSDGELQQAISTIPTLIAPANGIGTSALSRYKRDVHVLNAGAGTHPTILVIYNDPEVLPDSLASLIERPRHFVVMLDKGVYGYKTSFTYTTIGNPSGPERLRYLDYLDVDQDGVAELFLGYTFRGKVAATKVLRFESDAWKEIMIAGDRCQ